MNGIKTEMAENMLTGLKQVFVRIILISPKRKLMSLKKFTQLDTMEAKLNESIEENVVLSKECWHLYQEWDCDRDR